MPNNDETEISTKVDDLKMISADLALNQVPTENLRSLATAENRKGVRVLESYVLCLRHDDWGRQTKRVQRRIYKRHDVEKKTWHADPALRLPVPIESPCSPFLPWRRRLVAVGPRSSADGSVAETHQQFTSSLRVVSE